MILQFSRYRKNRMIDNVLLPIIVNISELDNKTIEITKENLKRANIEFTKLRNGFQLFYENNEACSLETVLLKNKIQINYTEKINSANNYYTNRLNDFKNNFVGKICLSDFSTHTFLNAFVVANITDLNYTYEIIDINHIYDKKYECILKKHEQVKKEFHANYEIYNGELHLSISDITLNKFDFGKSHQTRYDIENFKNLFDKNYITELNNEIKCYKEKYKDAISIVNPVEYYLRNKINIEPIDRNIVYKYGITGNYIISDNDNWINNYFKDNVVSYVDRIVYNKTLYDLNGNFITSKRKLIKNYDLYKEFATYGFKPQDYKGRLFMYFKSSKEGHKNAIKKFKKITNIDLT